MASVLVEFDEGTAAAAGPMLVAPGLEGEIDAIRSHPALTRAIHELFVTLTQQQAGEGLRRFVLGDKARRLAFWTAMSLDAERKVDCGPGLTVNRFCEHLTAHGEMSRGRARAIFEFMRHTGFLTRVGEAVRGKAVVYEPSERMNRLCAERLAFGMTALAKVSPSGTAALARIQNPAFLTGFARLARKHIISGFRPLDSAPALAIFIGRDGGEYIAMHLYLAHLDLPPEARAAGFAFNITKIAGLTHVSRSHVSTLVRDAAEAGLIERGPQRISVTAKFEDAVAQSLATTFATMADMARTAIADMARAAMAEMPGR
ncbi:hypothetical protein [Acuticoccus sediminis]|uniref:hypothetical protein n=1 Tax=Acuticoccus sediminis TaxID=2184697 RepID=UPI001CFE3F99|nr:hypothetical protein [Acuticoccus sediminis]